MTLYGRNAVFKAGIALSSACLLLGLAATAFVAPLYPALDVRPARPEGIFHFLVARHFQAAPLAAHFAILFAALYSLVALALIFRHFAKTQPPEIFFIALFAASLAPEALRLAIPLGEIWPTQPLYLTIAARAVFLFRYIGIFSLFAASVHASGYQPTRLRGSIAAMLASAFFVALAMPVDSHLWDSSLNMLSGRGSMFALVERGVLVLAPAGFLVAAHSRGLRLFAPVGAGAALALVGRNVLIGADTWAALACGAIFLAAGTWLACTRVHRIYLWM